MIRDARQLPDGHVVKGDVCLIGSGPAGLCIARELSRASLRVVVLEGGGLAPEPDSSDLYRGSSIGQAYGELESVRVRAFGGTSHHWAGMCTPLEGSDFRERSWVADSGWPFRLETLEPYYRRAHELLGLGRYDYRGEGWKGKRAPLAFGAASPLESRVFQLAHQRRRLGELWRAELARSENIDLYLHANVTSLDLRADAGALSGVTARVLGGPRLSATARHYVLAAGGLENPRLLLASDQVSERGVGNQHDLVGRYFMEHPHVDHYALLTASAAMPRAHFYRAAPPGKRGFSIWGFLSLKPEVREREQLLSTHVVLMPAKPGDRMLRDRNMVGHWPEVMATLADSCSGASEAAYSFGTPTEQAPNPSSRVRLGSERDALGMRRIELDWRLTELDLHTLSRTHELIAREFGRMGWGRVKLGVGSQWPRLTRWGCHHMGTTRMHDSPRKGVCDGLGTVHGVPNLTVAGSSLFPTSGSANPTLTILALALRQSEHLRQVLS